MPMLQRFRFIGMSLSLVVKVILSSKNFACPLSLYVGHCSELVVGEQAESCEFFVKKLRYMSRYLHWIVKNKKTHVAKDTTMYILVGSSLGAAFKNYH